MRRSGHGRQEDKGNYGDPMTHTFDPPLDRRAGRQWPLGRLPRFGQDDEAVVRILLAQQVRRMVQPRGRLLPTGRARGRHVRRR